MEMQSAVGQAAAAEKNRQREARLSIIQAFGRLGIPFREWPDFVHAYYTDPHQQSEYRQCMSPVPFQAPDFDRLNQSPEDWMNAADRAWALHRHAFLQGCESCVELGVDEEIVAAKRARGAGKKASPTREGSGVATIPPSIGDMNGLRNTSQECHCRNSVARMLTRPPWEESPGNSFARPVGRRKSAGRVRGERSADQKSSKQSKAPAAQN